MSIQKRYTAPGQTSGPFAAGLRDARPGRDEVGARRWLYVPYDRLTADAGPLATADPSATGVIFVESTEKASRRPYHKKKLALLLSNERHFALELAARGFKVLYAASDEPIGAALAGVARAHGLRRVSTTRPAERELRLDLEEARRLGLEVDELPDPTWLTSTDEFRATFRSGPPYRMDRFYRRVRARTGILMQGGKPVGGRLSFDAENRKAWRGAPVPPARPSFPPDELTREVLALVERRFPRHFGELEGFDLPTTRADAEVTWRFALDELLPHFGPYEDALSESHPDLFHSKVSALLNLGRLLPSRVVQDVVDRHAAGRVSLASAEGYVRQVLGWREFVRHVHEATDGYRNLDPAGPRNALGAHAPLPRLYWGAPSGLACADDVVRRVVREGYSHHITRLMVLGNLATLLGVSPRALTDWFWFAYVDAFDWVVEPNVLSMATWSDGGLMTTKPYVAGSAYLSRMGAEHCRRCRYDPKKTVGADACPFTALYWTFLERNEPALRGNQRMALPLATLAKRSEADRAALRERATLARAELGLPPTERSSPAARPS